MVVSAPRIVLNVFLLIFLLLLFGFGASVYFYNDLGAKLTKCVDYDPRDPVEIHVLGQVIDVVQEGKWIKTKFALCEKSLFPYNVLTIYTSVSQTYFRQGHKIQVKNSDSYSWDNQPIAIMRPWLLSQRQVILRPEILLSEDAIVDQFKDFKGFVCSDELICADRVTFVRSHGPVQLSTIAMLKNKLTLAFLWSSLSNKLVLFGMDFGAIGSVKEFQIFSKGKLL